MTLGTSRVPNFPPKVYDVYTWVGVCVWVGVWVEFITKLKVVAAAW